MISPKSSEDLKNRSLVCKTSRKRIRLSNREESEKVVASSFSSNEIEKCDIEIIPSNEEFEEHIIEIKKEPEDPRNASTETRNLCTAFLQQSYHKENHFEKPILIAEFDYTGSIKETEKRELQGTSTYQRIIDYTGEERLDSQTECDSTSELEGSSSYDVKINFGNQSSELDEKDFESKPDPDQLQWVEKLKIPERCQIPQHFMVDDFEEVKEILSIYEHETFTRLLVSDVNGGFRLKNTEYCGETVHFRGKGKQDLLFHGTPFAICGRLTFRCHQGIHTKRTDKEMKRDQKYGPDRKRYRKFTSSKKKNCPLKITVVKVLVFPDYNVDLAKESRSKLYKISSFIKKNKEKMKFLVKYIFTLPSVFDHRNHQLGDESVSREAVDKRVFDKVEEYVKAGITKAPVVKDLLRSFIQFDLEVDPSQWERRKYNPSLKDIRAKIYRTLCDMKAKLDPDTVNSEGRTTLKRKRSQSERKEGPGMDPGETFTSSLIAEEGNTELIIYEPDLQQNVTVDLSEGNVHREEMIAIASIIDVHDDTETDDKRKMIVDDDLSKLNLLSMVLRGSSLAELSVDLNAVVEKWRPVLDDVCDTKASPPRRDRSKGAGKRPRKDKGEDLLGHK